MKKYIKERRGKIIMSEDDEERYIRYLNKKKIRNNKEKLTQEFIKDIKDDIINFAYGG